MSLPIVPQFEEILRLSNVLHDGASEPEFLRFILSVDEIRRRLSDAKEECERLMCELQEVNSTRSGLERKLDSARQMFDMEKKKRIIAENKVNELGTQLARLRDEIREDSSGHTTHNCGLRSYFGKILRESDGGLSRISEALDSTGSLMSELGYTRSEEELEISRMQSPGYRKRRHSLRQDAPDGLKKPATNIGSCLVGPPKNPINFDAQECLISINTQDITENETPDPSREKSLLNHKKPQHDFVTPVEPEPTSLNSLAYNGSDNSIIYEDAVGNSLYPSPSACNSGMNLMAYARLNERAHFFCQKTTIRAEMCEPCGKRLKFGKMAAKCRDCRATVHLECKESLPLPCVPANCTPIAKRQLGVVSDYTPSSPPMIPALIVYCVNEIEARGLKEVGLYRISGSERDIKMLKEKFLRGRGAPNLSNIDVHVLSGTVKDFLRSLREPLVTSSLLSEFLRCLEASEESDQQARLYQVVADLPRPNRDTIAYMILHLQRVSDCPECKMSVESLAKVFGPTIIGYSSTNQDPSSMLLETMKQVAIVQLMMRTPSSYWACYVNNPQEEPVCENRTLETGGFSSSDSSPSLFQKTGFFSGSGGTFKFNKRRKFFNHL